MASGRYRIKEIATRLRKVDLPMPGVRMMVEWLEIPRPNVTGKFMREWISDASLNGLPYAPSCMAAQRFNSHDKSAGYARGKK